MHPLKVEYNQNSKHLSNHIKIRRDKYKMQNIFFLKFKNNLNHNKEKEKNLKFKKYLFIKKMQFNL